MKNVFMDIDVAVKKAVDKLYIENDEIRLEGMKINGEEVPWHVYAAVAERIKFNANLHGDSSVAGAKGHIILGPGNRKVFDVALGGKGEIWLKAATR